MDPVSVSDDALDGDEDVHVEISASEDSSDDAVEKKDAEPAAIEDAPKAELAVPDTIPQPIKPPLVVRSQQPTVPGLSPDDEVDVAWDAISSGVSAKAEAGPPAADVAKPAMETSVASSPYVDVPTPVVPIDLPRAARDDEAPSSLFENNDSADAAVAASPVSETEEPLALVSATDRDEQTVVRKEAPDAEPDRPLEPVSAESDEQTVVRIDASRADATSPEADAVTDPFAAPPPAALAAPPLRSPLGAALPPPPTVRSSAPPALGAPSLPPPPSFDRAGVSVPSSRKLPPAPPRRALPPPIARPSATATASFLESSDGAAPALAPPSMTALSAPPPPPAPVPVAAPLPPPPAPPVQSKRPSVPPPALPSSRRPSVPPPPAFDVRAPLLPPAATKVGPSENTPTIQVSSITGRSSAADFTPTVQIGRSQGASLRPLPPPARVPSFGPTLPRGASDPIRPKSSSIAPLVDSIPPPAGRIGSRRLVIALAALTFGVAVVFFGLRMRTGAVVITVASESGAAVKDVVVKVDGMVRCQATPCEVKDLEPGAHLVSASAAGLAAGAERAFSVSPGERTAEHVALGTAETARSELDVSGVGDGLRVFVDGRDLGPPPVAIRDIEPATHVVRVTGSGNLYQPYEETVRLEAGEARSLGPVRLKLLRGRLALSAGDGAEGARVEVDGRRVSHLPATIELSADQSHEVTAERRGFADFSEEVVFDNAADRSLEITLAPASGSAPPRANRVSSARAAASERPAVQSASAGGQATLDLTSTPPSNVVVNGRPMGHTPLRGVRVPAGAQTIVFVNPDLGRKITSTTVAPGAHGTVAVKF